MLVLLTHDVILINIIGVFPLNVIVGFRKNHRFSCIICLKFQKIGKLTYNTYASIIHHSYNNNYFRSLL